MQSLFTGALASVALFAATSAQAVMIEWTDWTSGGGTAAVGTVDGISVSYSGTSINFIQTAGGTNYWVPSGAYTSGNVDNAPPASDIISLSTGGTSTIMFGQAVFNPVIALVSWNGNVADFGVPIEVVSSGTGFSEPAVSRD